MQLYSRRSSKTIIVAASYPSKTGKRSFSLLQRAISRLYFGRSLL